MTNSAIRQGDVLVIAADEWPDTLLPVQPENGRLILARGEATGHHHSVALSDRVAMFRDDGAGSGMFLAVEAGEPVALEHQEHSALAVPPGRYRVLIQRTFRAGMSRRVED